MHSIKIKGTKINKGRSTIYRWNIRVSYNYNTGQEHTKHNDAQIKICMKFSYIRYNKYWFRHNHISSGRSIRMLDLRSLGYCKIKQGILQQHLSKYYRYQKVDILCNKFINALKKERKKKRQRKISMVRS